MTHKKRFIEITRYQPMDNEGYIVWVRVLDGEWGGDYDEVAETHFGTKKEAYAWAKANYPAVRIYYTPLEKTNHV